MLEFRGIFDDGIVRPTEPVALPPGTEVECRPVSGDRDKFWVPRTLEELVTEQGVGPVVRTADLQGDWPDDDDLDEFLNEVHRDRR